MNLIILLGVLLFQRQAPNLFVNNEYNSLLNKNIRKYNEDFSPLSDKRKRLILFTLGPYKFNYVKKENVKTDSCFLESKIIDMYVYSNPQTRKIQIVGLELERSDSLLSKLFEKYGNPDRGFSMGLAGKATHNEKKIFDIYYWKKNGFWIM